MNRKFLLSPILAASLAAFLIFICGASLQAMPLSPESVKSLRASGKLAEVAAREKQARARGIDAPGTNIMDAIRAQGQGRPHRDQTTLHVPVILVDFSDNEANADDYPAEHFDEMLFSQGALDPGSMREWYAANSYGEMDIVGEVVAWVRAPETYEYYINGQNGEGDYPQNVQRMVRDAASEANADIDFSDFDNDGDGEVDNLVVVHAGSGAEANGGDSTMIWSHSWALGEYAVRLDGVWINQYTIQPEDGQIGVFGHELGHGLFGLPDLYDRDYSSEGLGDWTMMAGGSWGGDGASPAHFDAWSRYRLGFSFPTVLDANQADLNIPPSENEDAAYLLWTDGWFGAEYFMIENRQQIGFDASLPGAGLLIYHVDEDVWDQNDYEWYPGHEDDGHYQVALEQADGGWGLEQGENRGDDGDPWPGSSGNQSFDTESTPNSLDYNDNETQVAVLNMAADGDNIICDLEVSAGGGGIEGGELAYDDGTPVYYIAVDNCWYRVTFTAPADLELRGVSFMPYNPTPNLDAPCRVQIYAEDADQNLSDLLWETELAEVPEWNSNDWNANWITVEIPREERFSFNQDDNFTVVYGPAPGDAADGWYPLMDEGTNVYRSYQYSGDEPASQNADWDNLNYDLLIRAQIGVPGGAEPDIALDADLLDFGEVSIGQSLDQTLTISNVGDTSLTVSDVRITPDGIFTVDWAGEELIDTAGQFQLTVSFLPENAEMYQAILYIYSDDPDEGRVSVDLMGIGFNRAPTVVDPIADVDVEEDGGRFQIARLNDVFSDPNGDPLTYSVSGPEALNLGIWGEDLLYMNPDSNLNGSQMEVTVTADDGREGLRALRLAVLNPNPARLRHLPESALVPRALRSLDTRSETPPRDESTQDLFLVTISPVNDPPECVDRQGTPIAAELEFNLAENQELRTILYSQDIDDDAGSLRWTISQLGGLPDGYRFTDNRNGTSTFVWTPDYFAGRVDPYTPVFQVEDTSGAFDEVTFNIHVTNVNRAPVWADHPDTLWNDEGQELVFQVTGSDPDADQLAISASSQNLPVGWQFLDNGDGTGVFSWTSGYEDAGAYTIQFLLSDGVDSSTTTVCIRVNDVNSATNPAAQTPDHYYLSAAYPNPFNVGTTIKFGVPVASRVSLEVWGVAGQRVAQLLDGFRHPGNYQVIWNAEILPAGVYLVRMQAEHFQQIQRLVLIK